MATQRTIDTAEKVLPFLVYCAQTRRITTYGELGKLTGDHPRTFSLPLGYIRDRILAPRGLPQLTALVVLASSRLPGDSFLPDGRERLSDEEYRLAYEQFRDEVFAYRGWDALLTELGLSPM
jgi:hypothetical protein